MNERDFEAPNMARLVAHSILLARRGAYKDMVSRLTGTAWKVVRFEHEINYCNEKIVKIDREIAELKRQQQCAPPP